MSWDRGGWAGAGSGVRPRARTLAGSGRESQHRAGGAGHGRLPLVRVPSGVVTVWWCVAPALLGALAGDAEPQGDVGPGVAEGAEAGDGLADGVVEVVGEVGHGGDGFDVSGGDAAAVGADDAAEERGVLVVLDDPRSPFWCQWLVDGELGGAGAGVSSGAPGRCSRCTGR